MPQSAQNLITSIYCASFPVGAFAGAVSSGMKDNNLITPVYTGITALLLILRDKLKCNPECVAQGFILAIFCYKLLLGLVDLQICLYCRYLGLVWRLELEK